MEEAESVCPVVHHLVEPLLNPQLTNQQFINCAFLERPPSCVSLLSYRTALILLIGDSLNLVCFCYINPGADRVLPHQTSGLEQGFSDLQITMRLTSSTS